jgi:predicted transposase YbfD/YdcC
MRLRTRLEALRTAIFTEVKIMPVTKPVTANLQVRFATLTDPRRRKITHPLLNFIVIAICAVICGADDFVAIADFGRRKRTWFRKILDLKNGIPSHDRFNAIFAMLSPAEFERCLLSWIQALHEVTGGQVIAIDGKTLRGSFDKASSKSAIHMISAWASANSISLGQVVADEKSNEITAIPKLLEMLHLKGATVTIDAIGCQTDIARRIIDGGGHYVLNVKGNQGRLRDGIEEFFAEFLDGNRPSVPVHQQHSTNSGHGRKEARWHYVCPVPRDLPDRQRWPGLKAIGMVISNTIRDGKECVDIHSYILSKKLAVKKFAAIVKGHWAIENELHWQLDVTFREDHCRIRKGNADANFSTLRRTALTLLKNEKTAKLGVKNKRLSAGWDEDYLLQVLVGT